MVTLEQVYKLAEQLPLDEQMNLAEKLILLKPDTLSIVSQNKSDIKLELEYCFLTAKLYRIYGDDLSIIVGLYKFYSANPKLTKTRSDLMVLHATGFIGRSTIHKVEPDRDGGGDVPHKPFICK